MSGPRDGVLAVEVGSQAVPVLEADLEDLLLLYMGHLDQVHQPLHREGRGRGEGGEREGKGNGKGRGRSVRPADQNALTTVQAAEYATESH